MTADAGANVDAVMRQLVERINQHREQLQGVTSDYRIELGGEGGGSYRLTIHDQQARLSSGAEEFTPRATIRLSADDFLALVEERVSPMGLLMKGRVKFEGDVSEAMRLQTLLRG